jgi:hypothetical protein
MKVGYPITCGGLAMADEKKRLIELINELVKHKAVKIIETAKNKDGRVYTLIMLFDVTIKKVVAK